MGVTDKVSNSRLPLRCDRDSFRVRLLWLLAQQSDSPTLLPKDLSGITRTNLTSQPPLLNDLQVRGQDPGVKS